jgi:Sulfotransferase family
MNNSDFFAPTFIVGVPRSGTTLLVTLLGEHPLLSALYETKFLRNLLMHCEKACWFLGDSISRKVVSYAGETHVARRFRSECEKFRRKVFSFDEWTTDPATGKQTNRDFPSGICYRREEFEGETDRWLKTLQAGPLTEEDVYRLAREYLNRLFSFHCGRTEKPYWINKTPGLLRHVCRIPKLFPNARVIHIIRDGRDVACSNLNLPWGPTTVPEAAARWRSLLTLGRNGVDPRVLRYLEIRYENLIRDPANTLAEILAFLDLEGNPERLFSLHTIHNTSTGVWKTKLDVKERKAFQRKAGDMLIALGYEKDQSWVDTTSKNQ